MTLNPKQERFVQEYLVDMNATQAAIRAGYSEKTAAQIASTLLRNIKISEAVAKAQKKVADKHGVTVDRIVSELALLGFSNMQDYMRVGADGDPVLDFSQLSRDQAAALTEVTVDTVRSARAGDDDGEGEPEVRRVKFKLADKRAALVDLGKHLGMFAERPSSQLNVTFIVEGGPQPVTLNARPKLAIEEG